jgi:recombination protein RecT
MNATTPAKRETKQQTPQVSPLQHFKELLDRQTPVFEASLPKRIVERFKATIITTLVERPDLHRCNPQSLINVCRHAAQDGLMLDGREAAIVPFKKDGVQIATYMPMVQGVRKKVRASGEIADLNCQVVYEGEPFDYQQGDEPYLRHKPALTGGSNRKIRGAYSIATFKDGTRSYEWMTFEQIEEARKSSNAVKAGKPTPWDHWYGEMARKTVMRRHGKSLPTASDIENIFRREELSRGDDDDGGGNAPPSNRITYERGTDYSVEHTLDEFASGPSESLPSSDGSIARNVIDEQGGGAQSQVVSDSPSTALDGSRAADDSAPPQESGNEAAAVHHDDEEVAVKIKDAWQRGKTDRGNGAQRKAIPGEFRNNPRLFNAWLDGYDGIEPRTRA